MARSPKKSIRFCGFLIDRIGFRLNCVGFMLARYGLLFDSFGLVWILVDLDGFLGPFIKTEQHILSDLFSLNIYETWIFLLYNIYLNWNTLII